MFLCFCLLLHQYHLFQRKNMGAGNQLYLFFLNQIIIISLFVQNRLISIHNPTCSLEIQLLQMYLYLNIHHHQYPGLRQLPLNRFHFYRFIPYLNKTGPPYYLFLFNFSLSQSSLWNQIFIKLVILVAYLNHHFLLITLQHFWIDAILELQDKYLILKIC